LQKRQTLWMARLVAISKNDHIRKVQALALSLDIRLRNAYLKAIDKLKKQDVDWFQVESYIEQSRPDLVIHYITTQLAQTGLQDYAKALTDAFIAGGELAASLIPAFTNSEGFTVNVAFNVANPALQSTMTSYQMTAIRGITEEVRQSIQAILRRTVSSGISPKVAAQEIRQIIGLAPSQVRAVDNYRRMLEDQPLRSLQNALRDKRFDRTVTRADLEQVAISPEQIDKMVTRYQERFLNYRATMIARTESIRALNMSNQALWQSYINEGKIQTHRVIKEWIFTSDDRTRAAHDGRKPDGIPSMNPDGVQLNQKFNSMYGPINFPGDPEADAANVIGCRCCLFIRIRG
jgi:hypothetical protein